MIGEDDASWKSRRKGLTSASELHVSSSCFLVYPPSSSSSPSPAHTRYLISILGNSFVGSSFVDTALAACLEHLPPLDFNPICLSTPSNPSGYLLGSFAENFSSDHLCKFNIFFLSVFSFFFFHNERLVLPFILLVSRDESTFVTNYIVRYAIVFFFFHIFLIYDRSLTKRIKNSRANY